MRSVLWQTLCLERCLSDTVVAASRQQQALRFYQRYRAFTTRPGLWHSQTNPLINQEGLRPEDAVETIGVSLDRTSDVVERARDQDKPKIKAQSAVEEAAVPKEPAESAVPKGAPGSRAESRKARRLRRVEAGTYKPAATAAAEHQAVNEQIERLLAKLDDELEGPSLAQQAQGIKVKRKETAEKLAAKAQTKDTAAVKEKQPASPSKPKRETWQTQKEALEEKFGEAGWQPRKRLSPDTLEGIRSLHASDPESYSTEILANHFKITPEAIRRILRSKWRPSEEEVEDRRIRWERRGAKKWAEMAEQGMRPPVKWRAMGAAGGTAGLREDRLPKRKKAGLKGEDLSWEQVVAGIQPEEETVPQVNVADRLL